MVAGTSNSIGSRKASTHLDSRYCLGSTPISTSERLRSYLESSTRFLLYPCCGALNLRLPPALELPDAELWPYIRSLYTVASGAGRASKALASAKRVTRGLISAP